MDYFLFAAALAFVACCEVMSACFFWFVSLAFDCFCEACFCTDFGDLSPMVGFPLVGLAGLRDGCFPEGVVAGTEDVG